MNSFINKLPIELHLPGYQYCGPGTKLEKRLARGDSGINRLDRACKEHDIAYSQHKDIENRREADRLLAEKAWQIAKSPDSSLRERTSAWLVTNAMKGKRKFGMGLRRAAGRKTRRKKTSFKNLVNSARVNGGGGGGGDVSPSTILAASRAAYRKAQLHLSGKEKPLAPRVLPIPPRTGGFLPFLIPLMASLSAVGSLAAGASSVAKAVTEARDAKRKLDEQKRHNLAMETQKIGNGLYLKPYRKGYGLFIGQPQQPSRHRRRRRQRI